MRFRARRALPIPLRQFYEHVEGRHHTPGTSSAPLSATPSSAAAPNNVTVPGPYRATLIELQVTSVRRASVCKESSARPSLFSHRRYLAHGLSVSVQILPRNVQHIHTYAVGRTGMMMLCPVPTVLCPLTNALTALWDENITSMVFKLVSPEQTYRSALLREGTRRALRTLQGRQSRTIRLPPSSDTMRNHRTPSQLALRTASLSLALPFRTLC
ncbi:hypothetical protein FKP32DRAFT_87152 [Trametes sanguinea]|nr:hypothetical protein FKP32DRAFT_87152 [Trametes sanguinea]